jgi:serine/threonine protein kinase/tetratricopeptide (TPR) repeat protein
MVAGSSGRGTLAASGMDGIEQALRGCGDAEVGAAAGLLDEVRRRMFGVEPTPIVLGRYRLVARVGAGGGGVVMRGEDPQLRRDVAIKLVHAHDDAERLLREARVLARLSHPDIVTIYDVGRVDGARDRGLARLVGAPVEGSVFLVMQWLEGGDLSHWLDASARSWNEILDAFTAAGRGLAAAHAAGVLHRDFKPSNVLLDGDGRPRVADFGLGHATAKPQSCDDDDGDDDELVTLRAGTPLYMAPEQHLGEGVDARSDQFAFCFALHEALFGARAFTSMAELVQLKLDGPPARNDSRIPAAIARVVARGLAPDPRERWLDMNALLDALTRARRPRSKALALLAVPVLLVAAVAVEPSGPALCEPDDPSWSSVWGEPREEIEDVFTSRAAGFGRDSFAAVDDRMSALGRAWSDAREQVCAAPSEAAAACLQDQRRHAIAIVDAWRAVERDGIVGAALELERLDDPIACLGSSPQREHSPLADDARRLDALVAAGRITEAATLADDVRPRLDADASRARIAVAVAFARAGRYAEAEQELVTAVHDAEARDDAKTSLRASTRLVSVVGSHLARPDDADRWARHTWATLARLDDDGTLAAEVHEHLGALAFGRGQWSRALDHYEESLRLAATVLPDDALHRAANLANAGAALVNMGRFREAIVRFEETVEIQRAELGEGHPGLAMTRHNLAAALGQSGAIERARDEATRALDAWTTAHGERHPDVALGLVTLASIHSAAGEIDRAIELGERARALRLELLGPDHPDTLTCTLNLAIAYEAAGRLPEAMALLEPLVVTYEQDPAPAPHEGLAWLNLGSMQMRVEDYDAAHRSLSRAHELLMVTHGKRHAAVGVLLLNLGVVMRELGELEGSLDMLAQAESVMLAAVGPSYPRLVAVHLERGRTAQRLGDREAARVAYTRALDLAAQAEHATEDQEMARAALAELDDT